jgi:hypothetical protein
MMLAYFGPETILPVWSTLAAAAGCALVFGKQVLRLASQALRRLGQVVLLRGRGPEPAGSARLGPPGRLARPDRVQA